MLNEILILNDQYAVIAKVFYVIFCELRFFQEMGPYH